MENTNKTEGKTSTESVGNKNTPERPEYDRCNKGHLLQWDINRNVWDCQICIEEMQKLNNEENNQNES